MTRRLLLLGFLLCSFASASAQQEKPNNQATLHAIVLGAGGINHYDSYLSPLEYRGATFSITRESLRMTRLANNHISYQSLLRGSFSTTESPARNADAWGGQVGYQAAWHYNWLPHPQLRLMAGGALGGMTGAVFHPRNGNNPAQAHFNIALYASAMAVYTPRIKGYPIALRYQIDAPLLGVMFSPRFGESYYQLSKNNLNGNFHVSHPGNMPSVCQMLTADFPLRHISLRVGYQCDIQQQNIHHIQSHQISHSALLGIVRHFQLAPARGKHSIL